MPAVAAIRIVGEESDAPVEVADERPANASRAESAGVNLASADPKVFSVYRPDKPRRDCAW